MEIEFSICVIVILGERRRTKKGKPKRPSKKSIFEIYEPSELKRSHFTDLDNEVGYTFVK